MQIVLDSTKGEWQYIPRVAALPQLDRGSDYESERHRFESCTPHQSNLKPGSFERPGFFPYELGFHRGPLGADP